MVHGCGFCVVTRCFREQNHLWVWLSPFGVLFVAVHDVKASNLSSLGILAHVAATGCLLKHCLYQTALCSVWNLYMLYLVKFKWVCGRNVHMLCTSRPDKWVFTS